MMRPSWNARSASRLKFVRAPIVGGAQTHVDDVELLVDRKCQRGDQLIGSAMRILADHLDGGEVHLGRDLQNDAGGRRAMTYAVGRPGGRAARAAVALNDLEMTFELAREKRVIAVNAAVDDRDADAFSGAVVKRIAQPIEIHDGAQRGDVGFLRHLACSILNQGVDERTHDAPLRGA